MVRYDLGFILCCCKAFLGPDDETEQGDGDESQENFYALLKVDRDATHEELKKAFKRESLKNHPDKLQQRGLTVTEKDQARFQRIKQAYEVLSDEHKRETYDAIGERGMKWIDEPFSIDPQELAHNFAKSSILDRSKIFAFFVAIAIAVLILPVLVCLHADGVFGADASWRATLVPLWLWNCVILSYHVRLILLGPIRRPDHIPEGEWQDPLPMTKRYLSCARFLLVFSFEWLVALKLDDAILLNWAVIFVPLFVWEGTNLYKNWPVATVRIVTLEDLETVIGRPLSEVTKEEKDKIRKLYAVVPSISSPEFAAASKLKMKARDEMMKSVFRIVFGALVLTQIDGVISWNWWLLFLPFWALTVVIACANYQSFAEVTKAAAEKDPTLFGMGAQEASGTASNYGTVGENGEATPSATAPSTSPLTDEEREELKAQVMASSSKLCSKCCSQGFVLILIFLFVAKLQGADFSSLWIISPFLFGVSYLQPPSRARAKDNISTSPPNCRLR
jgi:DnaJ domain